MAIHTAGSLLARALVKDLAIGPTTKRLRDGRNMHKAMCDAIIIAATTPGYYSEPIQAALRVGYGVALGWDKHIRQQRLGMDTVIMVNSLSAMQFAKLLGRMVDAHVGNAGQAEDYFLHLKEHA